MVLKNTTLAELAKLVGGELQGEGQVVIYGLADFEAAAAGEITFLVKARPPAEIAASRAAAVIVPLAVKTVAKPLIRVRDPNWAAAVIHNHLLQKPFAADGISTTAHIGENCRLPAAISIGPLAVLGQRVALGQRVTIAAGVVIGDDVEIGDDTLLHANVTIAAGSRIGARVIIHSGTVVGSDGFGYATDAQGRHVKRPHVGIVQIDDDVEIGAGVCIDRATFGKTWIRRGAKIDNLVQVGHNVEVGENCLLAAQVGLAGSAALGRNVVLGGQVGVNGHIRIDDRVMAAAKAGIFGNPGPGAVVSGMPAIAHKQWLKASAVFAKLPELLKEFRELRQRVTTLAKNLDRLTK